jgi:hypothetical protein
MSLYEEPVGRWLEVLVGLLVAFISLVFLGLVFLLISEASLSIATVIGGFILALCSYWFGQLSFRLVLNRKNSDGGLFSNGGLKFWCIFFGINSVIVIVFCLISNSILMVLGSLGMLVACIYGWKVANNRAATVE